MEANGYISKFHIPVFVFRVVIKVALFENASSLSPRYLDIHRNP